MSAAPETPLVEALRGRVCLLGLGNRDLGDDGAGPVLVDRLQGRTRALCLDGGVTPENVLERVARERPSVVLFADAADFGGAPGEVRLLPPQAHRNATLSTHAPSLELAADYLRARTGAVVRVLAIQAAATRPGRALSAPVDASLDILADRLVWLLANAESPSRDAGV